MLGTTCARGVPMSTPYRRLSPPGRPLVARLLVLFIWAGIACGGAHRVLLPPRLNLSAYGQIGLVTFTAENAKGSLHEFATQRFSEYVLAAQTGIEVLELGAADSVLRRTHASELGPRAAQALGGEGGVPVVFFGHLKVSNVKPSGSLAGLSLPRVDATVSAELSVELLSTKSGGTLWRSSAVASEQVGGLALGGGAPVLSAHAPDSAWGRLAHPLVSGVT